MMTAAGVPQSAVDPTITPLLASQMNQLNTASVRSTVQLVLSLQSDKHNSTRYTPSSVNTWQQAYVNNFK